MTVDDQSLLSSKAATEKTIEHIARLKEVTGIEDETILKHALDKSRDASGDYNLNYAIEVIISNHGKEEPVVVPPEQEAGAKMAPVPSPAVVMNPPVPPPDKPKVVDLTEDSSSKEDDLQRAIAMSLQEGGSVSTATSTGSAMGPPGVSQEDQDVSRALEASLLDNSGTRRKKEPQNPHDRERDGQWPVGLKNVGQTCWFSAVIQSLFHLPAFRMLVLSFTPPGQEPRTERQRKILEFMMELRKLFALLVGSQRNYVDPSHAVGILRGSLGGETVQTYCNNQQDVSEFTHKLLDWLEEAFKQTATFESPGKMKEEEPEEMDSELEKCDKEKEESSSDAVSDKTSLRTKANNPMYNLFYGRVKIEGKNQGNEFSREDPFGQWPLQVNGYHDIHDSLEASTAHEYFDTSCTDLGSSEAGPGHVGTSHLRKSGQEKWFYQLPPVLFFELSRFQFNQQRGFAEKINNILEFPETIYMDRYLEENKNITRSKREEVRKLKERRESLKCQLLTYTEYGSDPSHKFPLVNQIRNVLDFARSGVDNVATTSSGGDDPSRDIDMASPGAATAMQVDSPCSSPASLTPATSLANLATASRELKPLTQQKVLPDGSIQIPIKVEGAAVAAETEPAPTPMDVEESGAPSLGGGGKMEEVAAAAAAPSSAASPGVPPPAPLHVSELELKVLSGCLSRWRQEVEESIEYLNTSIGEIEKDIGMMYTSPGLQKRAYRLHAVMVHEGDINQGHYWAYVYHHERKQWLKFNDNTVSETSWGELRRESVGGHCHTSAYSLVYTDAARPDLTQTPSAGVSSAAATTAKLPQDLEAFLLDDNKMFAAEILRWDEEQQRRAEAAKSPAGGGDNVLIGDDPDCQIIETKADLVTSHALLAKQLTLESLQWYEGNRAENKSANNQVINHLYSTAKKRVGGAKMDGMGEKEEPRLASMVHYLVANDQDLNVLRVALLEQTNLGELETVSPAGQDVMRSARDQLQSTLLPKTPADVKLKETVARWHKCYHQFRIACNYFVLGVEKYTADLLEEAADLLTMSYIVNDRITKDEVTNIPSATSTKMNTRGLMKYFHLAVAAVNNKLVEEFETGNDPGDVADRVGRVLVPAIHILQQRTNMAITGRDANLLEDVRGRWCAMIEQPLPDTKRDYWGTIFNTVIPDDSAVVMRQPSNLRYPKLADDLKLESRYKNIMQRMMREDK